MNITEMDELISFSLKTGESRGFEGYNPLSLFVAFSPAVNRQPLMKGRP